MKSTLTYLSSRKISKSMSRSPEIILANKNLNWVNVLECYDLKTLGLVNEQNLV